MRSPNFQGKRRSPLDGIRAYCLWCCGGSPSEVSRCPSTDCACHPYRLGVIQPGAPRSLMAIIKARCLDCMPEGAAACDAYQDFGHHPPCPLWPFRLGRNPNYGKDLRQERRDRGKQQMNFAAPQPESGSGSASTVKPERLPIERHAGTFSGPDKSVPPESSLQTRLTQRCKPEVEQEVRPQGS